MRIKGRWLFLLLIVTTCIGGAMAQETLTLTLEQSIDLALHQNPLHLASEKRVEAAQSQMRQAAALFFPTLSVQGQKTIMEKVMELEFPSMIPGEPPQRVEVDFTRDYQAVMALNIPIVPSLLSVAGATQAKYGVRNSQEGVRQSRQTTIFNTKQAFFGCLLAERFVQVTGEAIEVAEKHYQNIKSLYEVGMASKFDLLRSEVQLANLKPQFIKARNSLEIAKLGLKTLLGIDLDHPLELEGELEYNPVELELESSIARAVEMRPELIQIRSQKEMSRKVLRLTRFSNLPSLSISGTYNFWADSFNFKKDNWTNFYAVNLVLTVPVFNGFATSARTAQVDASLHELLLTQKGMEDAVKLEVRQAFLKLQEARETMLSQEKNVEQAEESLRIAELNFAEGLITTLDVSSTQAALSQAKTNHAQALYDFVVAQAELDKAMGVD